MHTTNYVNTLIALAPDSTAERAVAPPARATPSIAERTFRMISAQPYALTSDDVIFGVFAERGGLSDADRSAARAQFFSKGQPCLRCSDLPKKYGWGVHSDDQGRVALVAVESERYRELLADPRIATVAAMRSTKA